jgi:alkylmercury lyase
VGFGLTLIPTPHRYEVDGRNFYTWSADDAMFFPAWFGHTAVIEFPDPIGGEKIRLTVTPEGVESVEPITAVVSRKYGGVDLENVRGTGCHYGHFFVSRKTASAYAALHAGLGLGSARRRKPSGSDRSYRSRNR